MHHAIVIGGSMSGLLCARVLCDHYRSVTLLERDTFPEGIENRRSVPQGRHAHGLLAGGREALERLFPGFGNDLVAAGALRGDIAGETRWFVNGGSLYRSCSEMQGIVASRACIETIVRRRVLAIPNLTVRQGAAVDGLLRDGTPARVAGVRIGGERLEAELVVDATGRGSHSGPWLEAMGYSRPREERVEVGVAYTTRHFRRTPEDLDGDRAAILPATPEGKRGGVMLAQEGGRWVVTLIGYFGNAAPSDLAGFVAYARSLPSPDIYDVIRNAEPLDEPAVARFSASLRRRYDKLARFPAGYLVVGDALCSFNPIYGQGMSVAALEAVALGEALRLGRADLARRFFGRAAKLVDVPWGIAVGNDLRMKETVGPRTPGVRFINWYIDKLHRAAHHDAETTLAFHRVSNLLAPPETLFHPRIVARVLSGNLRRRPAATTPAAVRTVESADR
ncbi:MAG: hypothetical protein JNK87_16275 [Bryobacterales bacterium]|nr:hypothetical protein [Bryobacterales bacterium]